MYPKAGLGCRSMVLEAHLFIYILCSTRVILQSKMGPKHYALPWVSGHSHLCFFPHQYFSVAISTLNVTFHFPCGSPTCCRLSQAGEF